MRFSGLSEIRAYWEALRGTAPMPRRAAFDPRGIERALPQSFLAARRDTVRHGALPSDGPGPLVLRIAGQQVCALAGGDLRGTAPEALLALPDRTALLHLLDEVLDGPAWAELDLDYRPHGGGAVQAARLLLLPLADAEGRVAYVLGGLAVQGDAPPLRGYSGGPKPPPPLAMLALRAARLNRLSARGNGDDSAAPAFAPDHRAHASHGGPGLAEAATPFAPPAAGRAHLRVVK